MLKSRLMAKIKMGIALGGGAARGLAHIGVLEVLEEEGLVPEVYAGTSMGALISAVYLSSQKPASWLRERLYEFIKSEVFKKARFDVLKESKPEENEGILESVAQTLRKGIMYTYSITRESIIPREIFTQIIEELVPDIKIEDLPKPFCAVSLDVFSGQEVVWTQGSLRQAVMASSAIPGFFPPLVVENKILVDGGYTNSVPVRPCRKLGADLVVAVDTSRGSEEIFEFRRGLDLILRTAQIMMKTLRELQLEEAEVLIQPPVMDIHWADFSNPDLIIERGRHSAMVKVKEIRFQLRKKRWKKFVQLKR